MSSFKSTDDVAASEEADLMLDQSEYAAIEIYEGWRLIWRKAREQQAAYATAIDRLQVSSGGCQRLM